MSAENKINSLLLENRSDNICSLFLDSVDETDVSSYSANFSLAILPNASVLFRIALSFSSKGFNFLSIF